jgi:signal transduction histidine kinase
MSLKSLNFRLAALFSILFIVFSVVLFVFTYVLLSSTLRREQQEEMRARMLEFWALYQSYGLDLLNDEEFSERTLQEWSLYLIRVADRQNQTLSFYLPEHWRGFSVDQIEAIPPPKEGDLIELRSQEDGGTLEVATLRLPDGNIFQIGINVEARIQTLKRFRRIFLLVAIPLLVLGFAGGLIFSRRSLRPINRLIQVTRSVVDTGQMDTRIPARGSGDELDELVTLFNRMLEKIESLIKGMREALDNVAHDLRTPMTRIVGKAQMALQPDEKEDEASRSLCKEALEDCLEESQAILTMLTTLMDISEAETGVMRLDKRLVDISALIEDITELYRYAAEEKGLTIETSLAGEISVSLDVNRMRQVFANLLDNAIKYTGAGGTITINLSRRQDEVVIGISDSGMGIPEEEIQNIWDRLYRGDRSRSEPGLGLGLSLVRAIVRAHDGLVEAHSQTGEGSRFTISLPLNITKV